MQLGYADDAIKMAGIFSSSSGMLGDFFIADLHKQVSVQVRKPLADIQHGGFGKAILIQNYSSVIDRRATADYGLCRIVSLLYSRKNG